jgi:hypothetical protein
MFFKGECLSDKLAGVYNYSYYNNNTIKEEFSSSLEKMLEDNERIVKRKLLKEKEVFDGEFINSIENAVLC